METSSVAGARVSATKFSTIPEVFRANAAARPDKTALVMPGGRSVSFAQLDRRVSRLVSALQSLGLQPGDRVALLAKNCIEYFEFYGACAGAFIPVPLNWRLSARELAVILEDCRPRILIHHQNFAATVADVAGQISFKPDVFAFSDNNSSSYEKMLAGASDGEADILSKPDDTACLLYTSGTTGKPKGAELTHRGLLQNCRAAAVETLHLREDDIGMAPMPLFHVGGMWYHGFPSFSAGCTTVLMPEFDPGAVLAATAALRVTNIHLVPTAIHALLAQPDFTQHDLSQLRIMYYAASSMPVELLRRAMRTLAHCSFVQGYGSTEGGMVSYLSEADHRRAARPGQEHLLLSCGRPLSGVTVTSEPPGGEVGEIVVRSKATMKGYWNNPQATQAAIGREGLHTGDLGRRDAEGYLYILDRKNDMIVSGGENVYPREIEDVLFAHPAIAQAAVFDLPDPRWVQRVVAAVVLRPGCDLSPNGLIATLKTQLAGYKCPKQIFFTDDLPKNGAGKVVRRILRERYAGEADKV
jgi:acyl-CoA synthetase (AMP-forming)/AMP-acid ligase II